MHNLVFEELQERDASNFQRCGLVEKIERANLLATETGSVIEGSSVGVVSTMLDFTQLEMDDVLAHIRSVSEEIYLDSPVNFLDAAEVAKRKDPEYPMSTRKKKYPAPDTRIDKYRPPLADMSSELALSKFHLETVPRIDYQTAVYDTYFDMIPEAVIEGTYDKLNYIGLQDSRVMRKSSLDENSITAVSKVIEHAVYNYAYGVNFQKMALVMNGGYSSVALSYMSDRPDAKAKAFMLHNTTAADRKRVQSRMRRRAEGMEWESLMLYESENPQELDDDYFVLDYYPQEVFPSYYRKGGGFIFLMDLPVEYCVSFNIFPNSASAFSYLERNRDLMKDEIGYVSFIGRGGKRFRAVHVLHDIFIDIDDVDSMKQSLLRQGMVVNEIPVATLSSEKCLTTFAARFFKVFEVVSRCRYEGEVEDVGLDQLNEVKSISEYLYLYPGRVVYKTPGEIRDFYGVDPTFKVRHWFVAIPDTNGVPISYLFDMEVPGSYSERRKYIVKSPFQLISLSPIPLVTGNILVSKGFFEIPRVHYWSEIKSVPGLLVPHQRPVTSDKRVFVSMDEFYYIDIGFNPAIGLVRTKRPSPIVMLGGSKQLGMPLSIVNMYELECIIGGMEVRKAPVGYILGRSIIVPASTSFIPIGMETLTRLQNLVGLPMEAVLDEAGRLRYPRITVDNDGRLKSSFWNLGFLYKQRKDIVGASNYDRVLVELITDEILDIDYPALMFAASHKYSFMDFN